MSSRIFIITGTSGVGKDSVITKIRETNFDFEWVKTTVSRPMRKDETEGNPYYFVTPEEFKNKIEKKEMIEYALVYGKYYGAEKREIERCISLGKPVIWKCDVQGVPVIKKHYPESICIFIAAPSFEILEKRVRSRAQDGEEAIQERMRLAHEEMNGIENNPLYNYIVVNEENRLDETVEKIFKIIKKPSVSAN